MEQNNDEYFEYLNQRSSLGLIYRKNFLYPRLAREMQGKVLDVGCGIGDFLEFYKNAKGTDINIKNVEYCSKIGLEVSFMENGVIPHDHESFESAVLDNVLEHVEDPKFLLSEINRILCKKGLLIIGVPGFKGYESDSDHKIFYEEELLKKTLSKNNFNLKKFFYMPLFKSIFLSKIIRQYCIYGVFIKNN